MLDLFFMRVDFITNLLTLKDTSQRRTHLFYFVGIMSQKEKLTQPKEN